MIAILLATYNGEKYLPEQLQSLLAQTEQDWRLYVRDDCSNDATLEIIREFQKEFPEKVIILNNLGSNLGAKNSFIELLKFADAEYYMFCDQDDVWLPNKIEKSYSELKKIEEQYGDKEILVFCDAVVVDENLNLLSDSFWKTTKTNPHQLKQGRRFEVFNCAPGCTMFFNHELKKKLFPFPMKASMHDWWVAIIAQRIGIVHPFDDGLILYRQHGSNTIGAENVNRSYFLSKLRNLAAVFSAQKRHLEFLKEGNGINVFHFYLIKLSYSIRRFLTT